MPSHDLARWGLLEGSPQLMATMYTFVIYRQILRKVMPRRGSSACHVNGQPQAGGLAIGTPKDSTMPSPERQSSFTMDSLSSERSHTDDGASPATDPSDTHESPPESPSVRNSPLKAMRKLQRWDELGQGPRI